MSIFLDGLTILWNDLAPIAIFAVAILGLGLWITPQGPEAGRAGGWHLTLALGAGCALLVLLATALFLLARPWPWVTGAGCIGIALFAVAGIVREWRRRRAAAAGGMDLRPVALGVACFALLLVLRLAFLRWLLMPPYHDSPQHYTLVQNMLSAASPAGGLLKRYYHLGFHGLAAWTVSVTGADIASVLPLLGQVLVVLAPACAAGLAWVLTRDGRAAAFTGLVAAVGWKMPAFAANWGKYPAIASIALLPAALAVLYVLFRTRRDPRAWLAASALVAGVTVLHTRSLILLGIAVLSFLIVFRLPVPAGRPLWMAALIALPAGAAFLLLRGPLAQTYCDGGCLPVWLIFLLLPFAVQAFPRLSLGVCVAALGIFAASQLRLPAGLRIYSSVFLDSTYVQISLFLPLALLGGAGLGGLALRLAGQPFLQRALTGLATVILLVNFAAYGLFYPDTCCNYVKPDDLEAFRWIRAETAADAVIIIPAYRAGSQMIGTDAGIWLHALTGRNANKRPYTLNWNSTDTLPKLCPPTPADVYVYSGDLIYSYPPAALAAENWLTPVFISDSTRIYRVLGCPD